MSEKVKVLAEWQDEDKTNWRVDRVSTKHTLKYQLIRVSDINDWSPAIWLERRWSLVNLVRDAALFFGIEVPGAENAKNGYLQYRGR